MTNEQIGFVAGLDAEKSVTENCLAVPDDVQAPIGRIVKRDSLSGWHEWSWHAPEVEQELTKKPVDVDQTADVGHHVQDFWRENQRWRLCLWKYISAYKE